MTEAQRRFATADELIAHIIANSLSWPEARPLLIAFGLDAEKEWAAIEQARADAEAEPKPDAEGRVWNVTPIRRLGANAAPKDGAKAKADFSRPELQLERVAQPKAVPDWAKVDWDEPVQAKAPEPVEPVAAPTKAEVLNDLAAALVEGEKLGVAHKLLIAELADVFVNSGDQYDEQKAQVSEATGKSKGDVHRAVLALVKKEKAEQEPDLTQAQRAAHIAFDYRLWSTDRDPYVTIVVDGHWENYPVDSEAFNDVLIGEYSQRYEIEVKGQRFPGALGASALKDAKAIICARARAATKPVATALRVGAPPEGGEVWLDLGRKDWTLVRITPEGWELFREGAPAVAFIRKGDMRELPIPERGGDVRELRKFVHVRDEDLALEVGSQLGVLSPKRSYGSYPVVMMTGVSGVAKTTSCRVFQCLSDPNTPPGPFPKSEDDLMITVADVWLPCFDNISKISDQESDALCRISTGAGYKKRKLHSDGETFRMEVCRPVLLNGIPDDLANKTDLAKRAIVFELREFEDGEQLGEEEFWSGFVEAQPRILGALLDGLVGALADCGKIDLSKHDGIRMMDFAKFAEAGCRRLGFEEDEFLDALVANQSRAMRIAFDQDPVAQAIALLIERRKDGVWRGNLEPLHEALQKVAPAAILRSKRWPTDAVWLGRALRRSVVVLRKHCGIRIAFDQDLRKTGEGESHGIEIRRSAGNE